MGRRTWTLILLIVFFLGAGYIGSQIYVYRKCVKALQSITLPNTQIIIKKFNFQIHRSRLNLSNISIRSKSEVLNIGELEIQMHPSSFSKAKIIITKARIRGFSFPVGSHLGNVFSKFFKSNLEFSKTAIPLVVNELLISDIRAQTKRSSSKNYLKIPSIKRYKLKSRAAKLNGSMDFLVHVIYFILQSSLSESESAPGFNANNRMPANQVSRGNSHEESFRDSIVSKMKGFVKSVLGSN